MDWKSLALWLADCHAATAMYDGALKSTSRSRRQRFESICRQAHEAIETGVFEKQCRDQDAILKRLWSASNKAW